MNSAQIAKPSNMFGSPSSLVLVVVESFGVGGAFHVSEVDDADFLHM